MVNRLGWKGGPWDYLPIEVRGARELCSYGDWGSGMRFKELGRVVGRGINRFCG